MTHKKFATTSLTIIMVLSMILGNSYMVGAQNQNPPVTPTPATAPVGGNTHGEVTNAERQAAAKRAAEARGAALAANPSLSTQALPAMDPGGVPDYFGTTPNWANSPIPASIAINGDGSGAYALAVLDTSGAVAGVEMVTEGSDYTDAATSVSVVGGGGSGAELAAVIDPGTGAITSINVVAPGSGYNTVPGIRKFVDSLAGLGSAGVNDLGQYIPVATADTIAYAGSGSFGSPGYVPPADYYEIALVQYTEQLHKDLPPTLLRGYVQIETANVTGKHLSLSCNGTTLFEVDNPHYLGPIIVSSSYDPNKAAGVAGNGKPTRIKFHNCLPTGTGGDLFIPVDTTIMGAGMGPLHTDGVTPCDPSVDTTCAMYTENRGTLHLHGGNTPWISDGTPHQWTTPATESTAYPEGVSVYNVPDMDGGVEPQGTLTFYYTNEQSARLMFYHDHSYGITRLNVYAGEAAGYLVTDPVEQTLISGGTIPGTTTVVPAGTIPSTEIPLIIQDKTFVPSTPQMAVQDPTWNWGSTPGTVHVGDLWFPHVYMPNQNPFDIAGVNATGRWDYGPWFWPPFVNLTHGQVPNPLYPSLTNPLEGPFNPGTPNPSLTPESFMDTPLVNGTVYPFLNLNRQAYRFRILNAANDRSWNLQLYCAKSNGTMWNLDGTLADANAGEVNMVPADPNTGLPASWPTDGRAGGVPDPAAVGPSFIQIGTEAGLIPNPAVLPNTPIGYNYNRRDIVVLNVANKTLFLGPAERADVIVDFSQVPTSCSNLILYNDAPAPVPAFDSRIDYYTGDVDQTNAGGAPTTLPGYGPNTRTIMQIRLSGSIGTAFNLAALQAALPVAFAASQPAPIVPQADFNAAYGANYPTDAYARIQDTSMTFIPASSTVQGVTLLSGGSGYGSTPTVQFTGGVGTGVSATAIVQGGVVTGVTITNGGSGYSASNPPAVTFVGGSPTTPASGTAYIAPVSTAINRVTVTSQGTGYTSLPSVDLVGGSGSGATAVASYTYGLNTIAVTSGGSGYVTPGVAIIDPTGKGATATATVTAGAITAVTVTNAGSGYTAPVIEFTGVGTGAVANATLTSGILTIKVTNGGFGYTSTGLPHVVLTGGGFTTPATAVADVSVLIGLQPKAIQELFTLDYGRMNATLGVEIPNTTGVNQTTIPLGFIDPATEIVQNSNAMVPLGTLSDGTQIWKVTHNGVDTHAIHFHLFNVQLINRVGWDGAVRPPEPNEIGWKEVVRMNPLEDAIVALRPIIPIVPWSLPNSVRPDDVTMPSDSVRTGVLDPLNLATDVSNNPINFGWEYVWHCHLLGHEENDMMRPIIIAVAPEAPSSLAIGGGSTITNIILNWTNNSLMTTSYIVQRAINPEFTINLTQFPVTGTTFTDTTNTSPTPVLYYRVLAASTVGGSGGAYPNDTALSSPSNTVSFGSTGKHLLTTISPHGTLNMSASPSQPGPDYLNATNVTITVAALETGWTFSSWSGACSGSGSCVVSMSANRSVTAHYAQTHPVISGNAGVAGATITYTGGSTTADGSGNYSFISSSTPWSGTVTPSLLGYSFSPVSRTYTAITTDQPAQNYTATPITFTISGNTTVGGATLSYTDGTPKLVTSDSSGNYTLTVSYNWSGTVTATKTGYIMSAPKVYTNVLANLSGQNYTVTAISYTITGNAGIGGAIMSYFDVTPKSVAADGTGAYTITVPYLWSGTVTPSFAGTTFSPVSRTYPPLLANQTAQNYTATPSLPVISGNAVVPGAILNYTDGTPKTAVTDASGNYSFTVSMGWTGTVTPGLTGYSFVPSSRTYSTPVTTNQIGQDYVGSAITFTIMGHINTPGVTLSYLIGSSLQVVSESALPDPADPSGRYSYILTVPYNWSGMVVPSKTGFTFAPINRSYLNTLANVATQDYVATAITYTISGNAGAAGVVLSYTDGTPKTATADGAGAYSFIVSYNWSGTVTPALGGNTFWPTNRPYVNVLANQVNQNYVINWVGGAVVTSDRNVLAIGSPIIGTEVASYGGFTAGNSTMYVPMLFKQMWTVYDSALYVQNTDTINISHITIKFYDTTGVLSCTKTDTIPPQSSVGYWLPSETCLPPSWVGGVVITDDTNIVAVGRPHIGGQIMTYNGFSGGSLTMYLPMLFKQTFGYDSAFYVQNTDTLATANITYKFYDTTGSLSCTMPDTIPPLSSHGYWLPSLGCLPPSWAGSVVATSDTNIVAVGRPHLGSEITSYDGSATGSLAAYAPALFKNANGTDNAALYVQDVDPTNTANITIKFYDSTGSLSCTITDTVLAGSSKGYWIPAESCLPSSWTGSALVTSDFPVVIVGRPHFGTSVTAYDGFAAGGTANNVPMLFKQMWTVYNAKMYLENTDTVNTANITTRFYDINGNLTCTKTDTIGPMAVLAYWLPTLTCTP